MVECCQNMPVWVTGGAIKSKKVLICVDSSDNSLRAVNHAGLMLAGTDCTLTIFHTIRHIMSFIPKELLDEAPDLEEIWQKRAGSEMTPFIEESKAMLVNAGIGEERIEIKIINGTGSAARDILDEAKEGDYGTIVLGRRGISKMKELFMGSVTNKVLQASHGV